MLFIGIDPGVGGGLAIIASDRTVWGVTKMPRTERELVDTLKNVQAFARKTGTPLSALLERVWSVPIQGHVGAFTFGMSYGTIRGVLTALDIPWGVVLPKAWQSALGIVYPEKSTDTVKKNITKERAQRLFRKITVTHAVADAMLLAEFHRRTYVDGVVTQPAKIEDRNGKATSTEKGKAARR